MNWRQAVDDSDLGSATRRVDLGDGTFKTMIRYGDGDGYIMVAKDGVVDYDRCRAPGKYELDGFDDWKPSEEI